MQLQAASLFETGSLKEIEHALDLSEAWEPDALDLGVCLDAVNNHRPQVVELQVVDPQRLRVVQRLPLTFSQRSFANLARLVLELLQSKNQSMLDSFHKDRLCVNLQSH